jgi:hypothetical protein
MLKEISYFLSVNYKKRHINLLLKQGGVSISGAIEHIPKKILTN